MRVAVTRAADRTQSLPASLAAYSCGCLGYGSINCMKIPDRRLPTEDNGASLGGENPRVHAST